MKKSRRWLRIEEWIPARKHYDKYIKCAILQSDNHIGWTSLSLHFENCCIELESSLEGCRYHLVSHYLILSRGDWQRHASVLSHDSV